MVSVNRVSFTSNFRREVDMNLPQHIINWIRNSLAPPATGLEQNRAVKFYNLEAQLVLEEALMPNLTFKGTD